MIRQKGFIALYALLSLALLLGITVLALAHWDGIVQRERRAGGEAIARRIAHAYIQENMFSRMEEVSRPWSPPLAGEASFEGSKLEWRRVPVDSRWRAGARSWTPELVEALSRLGARQDRIRSWNGWMQSRESSANRQISGRIGLITDAQFLSSVFGDLGLEPRWGAPGRIWTMDPAGAAERLNLLGADPEVVAALSGVPEQRLRDFQSLADRGFADASSATGYWRFDEWQALSRWCVVHPVSAELWVVKVWIPQLREPVLTRWRVSQDDGTPGNPWFRVQTWSLDQW